MTTVRRNHLNQKNMSRQKNDGRGRIGGRAKGTPNKTTSTVKEWLTKLIQDNRQQVEDDLRNVLPEERLRIIASLLNYVVPKQQTVSIEESMAAEYRELERLLQTAPDEAIDRIAERIKEMENYNKDKEGIR